MHWIKPTKTDSYVVQTPEEVADLLERAFGKTEPISSAKYMSVVTAACPPPKELLPTARAGVVATKE